MNSSIPWLGSAVLVRTLIILLVLAVGIRLFGKRDVGGLNLLDLVMVLLLGNAVQNAITGGSGRLLIGLISAGTLLLADQVIGILFVRKPWLEARLYGAPTIIAVDGKMDTRSMQREGVEADEVMTAMREMGLEDFGQVHLAILEDDGTISIIPKSNVTK